MARSNTAAVQVDAVAPSGSLLRQVTAQVQAFIAEVNPNSLRWETTTLLTQSGTTPVAA